MWWWLLVACSTTPASWITPEGDVSAAVVEEDGRMLAYVCGNEDDTRDDFSRWFEAPWEEDGFVAETADWRLEGVLDGDTLLLTLDGPDGERRSLNGNAEEAAIYSQEETCLDGAIATEGRVDGTWCAPDGTRFQVEPVETVVLGETLELALPDGARRTFRREFP